MLNRKIDIKVCMTYEKRFTVFRLSFLVHCILKLLIEQVVKVGYFIYFLIPLLWFPGLLSVTDKIQLGF